MQSDWLRLTHPETTPITNFGNSGPIWMKLGGVVKFRLSNSKIVCNISGGMTHRHSIVHLGGQKPRYFFKALSFLKY